MAKSDKFHPKSHYDQNPGDLPESLELLEGHSFHSVARIRFGGNENRTLLALFRPKHLKALFEHFESKIKVMKQVLKAQKRVASNKLKAKDAALRVVRRDLLAAQSDLEEVEETLQETIIARDKALAKVESLSKKQKSPSASAKEIKILSGQLQSANEKGEGYRGERDRLDERFQNLTSENERNKIALSNTEKANTQLMARVRIAEALLESNNIRLPGVEESSGIKSATTVMYDSNIKVFGNKPLPGSNAG